MRIIIKSEMDSRPMIYPLIRCLYNFGNILVVTNNRILNRLIENEESRGFRNITVLVDDASSADEICETYNITEGAFDFVIFDNVSTAQYDYCFILTGDKVSPEFDETIELLMQDENVNCFIIKFGQSKGKAVRQPERSPKKEKKAVKADNNAVQEEYDPAEKFRARAQEKSTRRRQAVSVPFPSFQDIELLESEHRFAKMNETIASAIYELIGKELAISIKDFKAEVRKIDESSGYINSRDAVR